MEDQKENICVEDADKKKSCAESEKEEKPRQVKPCGPEGDSETPSPSVRSEFSDPVYKEIALANGHINRMTRDELRGKLAELKLDTRGVKDVLKKRLKSYYKKQKLLHSAESGETDTYYDYICVVDFEATCEENNPPDFLHEIIEFPIVLINTHTMEIEDTFQEYVRPVLNTQLSDFCIKLTGISQETVDKADPFPDVLQRAVLWLQEKELGIKHKYAVLTDGSWDMSKFLNIQCRVSQIRYPQFAKKWINIRKSYGNFYKVPRMQTKLSSMLENLGLQYEGRPHCGLDDSCNIARIALRMLQDGCQLRVNERMHAGQLLSVPSSAPVEGAPPPFNPHSRN
ncbi:3'-5' exoribonuclease 1 [Scleropages formosus]|uniref:3'-5' exoribonuclease 1 n=1 Tax=Scleropages formosus TaxID=113540 RepID=A0A8C9SV00_SCLFO|nr:3'-5' exoribonuclease 1 [Scleropages formosus]XP_018604301.1 3'-5' exoribonuclease 1 [Scleropages formosus]XP_018604310.1 3'-5' exoribonuclease 1 [Scleropages formosus]XP_018604319.1 3'-5' exoribonuclease 1 [Scleropages formosus]